MAKRKQIDELTRTQHAEPWARGTWNQDAKGEAWLKLPKEIRAEDHIIFKPA